MSDRLFNWNIRSVAFKQGIAKGLSVQDAYDLAMCKLYRDAGKRLPWAGVNQTFLKRLNMFQPNRSDFGEWLDEHGYANQNWFLGRHHPQRCESFRATVEDAYGNAHLTGIQGDFRCMVYLKGSDGERREALVTVGFNEDAQEYYLHIEELEE